MTSAQAYYAQLRKACGTASQDNWKRSPEKRQEFYDAMANKYGIEVKAQMKEVENEGDSELSSRERQLAMYTKMMREKWAGKQPNWKKLQYGVLPTLQLHAMALDVPDSDGHLIVADDTIFTTIYLIAKAVCGYMLVPTENKTQMSVLSIENIDQALDDNPVGIGRFIEALVAFHIMKNGASARPYLVDQGTMQYSGDLTNAAILYMLSIQTLTIMLDDAPRQKSGVIGRLFGRNKPEPQSEPVKTRFIDTTICNTTVKKQVPIATEIQHLGYELAAQRTMNLQDDWTTILAGLELFIGLERIFSEIKGNDADTTIKNYRTHRRLILTHIPDDAIEHIMPLLDTIQELMSKIWERERQTYYRFEQQPRSPRNN